MSLIMQTIPTGSKLIHPEIHFAFSDRHPEQHEVAMRRLEQGARLHRVRGRRWTSQG